MAANVYRCILTGLGGRGRHWARILAARTDCEIVACAEPHEPNRRLAADLPLAAERIFPSLAEALKHAPADFVMDVTPPAVHHQVAEQAFAAGLHVLGEKPLSDDFDVARQLAALGRAAGRQHMITQNYRFQPPARHARALLADGLIGRPEQCDIRFYMNWADLPGSHYVNQPYMFIKDMMVHHFDLLRFILGADPVAVQAITWNHSWSWLKGDSAHAILFEFPNNLFATHVSCGCAVGSRTTSNGDWRIEGPQGSLDWKDTALWHNHLHRTETPVQRSLDLPEMPTPEQAIVSEFFAAIAERRDPECSATDNLKSLAMVFATIRSAEEGRRVELAELSR